MYVGLRDYLSHSSSRRTRFRRTRRLASLGPADEVPMALGGNCATADMDVDVVSVGPVDEVQVAPGPNYATACVW